MKNITPQHVESDVAEATFPHYNKSSNKSKIDSESNCEL